jgi:hypothetical protein
VILPYTVSICSKIFIFANPLSPYIYGAQRVSNKNELARESDRELCRVLFLEAQLQDMRRKFDSLAFPKYMKFGFISLVVYAVLGVIFPLTYGVWGEYMLEDNVDLMFLIFHPNDIALLLSGCYKRYNCR